MTWLLGQRKLAGQLKSLKAACGGTSGEAATVAEGDTAEELEKGALGRSSCGKLTGCDLRRPSRTSRSCLTLGGGGASRQRK